MNNALIPQDPNGKDRVPVDRKSKQLAAQVVNEVRLAALRAEGSMALAGHLMGQVRDLDDERRALAKGDPTLDYILTEIEATALAQVKAIQKGLYNPFGI